MSKRRLTHREQLRKMIKAAEPGSILSNELAAVQAIILKPKYRATTELLNLLKPVLQQETKWFITTIFESVRDERIIRPLMRAMQAPENTKCRSFFLWPLIKYDCTKHLKFFVNFIDKLDEPGEAMMVSIEVIRAMKGPFEPILARKSIRKLLAETTVLMDAETKMQTEAFRLEAADFIMAKYFNQTRKAFWQERGGSVIIF
ncbi:hypothetical protein ACFQ48_08330 [Hymenobacter caeli]|uniref:HEAT repeat domain-containing protein n=1 Tax=Hymenobacter caeli TaxID=2735894 RepID=A0ABX2FPN1_9BACT|nr:hypothetical protein [Hymenobacter caeli]NRT19137.1 hypothetical protein [Hymenobacter caeli]